MPNENSSAPSSAATTTSRPVLKPPSTRTRTRPRSPFATSACWVSASPSSHGAPACLIDGSGLAPVPPSAPATWTMSARAFATPAAMTPTPADATSFTETSASGLTSFRSKTSWARSSIEYTSWCGGGEISATPGEVPRRRAISSVTLCAGIWPPSPGFEPWATLIWSSSADTAYSAVTPNRPEAICLIFELRSSR